MGIVTDNSPLLRIKADSFLNNRISLGNRFNKRVKIPLEDSPKQDYMQSRMDLSCLPDQTDYVPVHSDMSVARALAERGMTEPII